MSTNILTTSNNITGTISKCPIKTVELLVKRESVYSLTQTVTYHNYNVCTGLTINQYDYKEVTPVGVLFGSLGATLLICIVVVAFISWIDG